MTLYTIGSTHWNIFLAIYSKQTNGSGRYFAKIDKHVHCSCSLFMLRKKSFYCKYFRMASGPALDRSPISDGRSQSGSTTTPAGASPTPTRLRGGGICGPRQRMLRWPCDLSPRWGPAEARRPRLWSVVAGSFTEEDTLVISQL